MDKMVENEEKCGCGKESTRGCHGVKDGQIYSEHFCDGCFHDRNSKDQLGGKDEVSKVI